MRKLIIVLTLVLASAAISFGQEKMGFENNAIIIGNYTLSEVIGGLMAGNQPTGWLEGGQITINTEDDTKLDITAGSVAIVSGTETNSTIQIISWTNQTALNPALTTRSKWVGVKDDGTGNAQFVYDIEFDVVERRTTAILGRIWDSGGTGPTITNVGDYERPAWGLLTAFQDFILEYGSWNISGNVYSANGTNLLLDKSAGVSFRYHAEDVVGQENVHSDAAQSPRNTYAYHLQGSSTTTTETDIESDYYDNAGVKVALPNNQWTVQEVWFFPVSLTCHVLYGQIIYNSKADAIDGITTETKVRNTDILSGAILRAYLVVEQGCTDLTDDATAEIRKAGNGAGGGGGSALWTRSGTDVSLTVAGDDILLNTEETFSIADMTTGSVPFIGASGLFLQDNANLFWDNANNRLGIGTTNPNAPLEVKGLYPGTVGGFPSGILHVTTADNSEFSNSVITGHNSYTGNTQLWYFGSTSNSNDDIGFINRQVGDIFFWTNATERLRITNDGKVGIGTNSPQGALDVSSTTGAFIVPRMTTTQRNALTAVNGMIIYNTSTNQFNFYENGAWVTK